MRVEPEIENTSKSDTIDRHSNVVITKSEQNNIQLETDIGYYVYETKTLNENMKLIVLKESNIPNHDFQYPFSIHNKMVRKKNDF